MLSDIEIAHSVTPLPITEVARQAGVDEAHLIPYGSDKAKVDYSLLNEESDHQAKLVLVTAINPTPAGEGKTTTTIGLADALRRRGVKSAVALREPSLGPVFGVKGGAAGGGYAQVVPMEDINLHFTGDFHAIGAANNLLAAMLDNHIQQGNALGIDVKRITWKRAVDMNDRQLRHVIDGIGGKAQGVPREDGFDITVASEVMAILCLSTSISDLKQRLGEIVVGYNYAGEPVRASQLKAQQVVLEDVLGEGTGVEERRVFEAQARDRAGLVDEPLLARDGAAIGGGGAHGRPPLVHAAPRAQDALRARRAAPAAVLVKRAGGGYQKRGIKRLHGDGHAAHPNR